MSQSTFTAIQVIAADEAARESVLAPMREKIGDAHAVQYGATKEYAAVLFQFFRADWYEVEHNDIAEEAKPILAEAKRFREALKARGHKNPSVAWTRVRKEGRAIALGADADEGEKKTTRSIRLRMVEDLSALYKAAKREESLAADTAQALTHIASALTALGVDLAMLNPAK